MLTFLSSQCWHLFIVAFYLRSSRLFRWQVVFNWKQSFSYYVLRLLILFKPLVLVGFPRHLSWRRRDATHYCLEVDVQVPIQPPLTPKKGCPHSCCTGVGVQAPLMIIDTVEGKKRQAHYWPGGMKILASCLASPHTTPLVMLRLLITGPWGWKSKCSTRPLLVRLAVELQFFSGVWLEKRGYHLNIFCLARMPLSWPFG